MPRHPLHAAIAFAAGILVCARAEAQQTGTPRGTLSDTASCLERSVSTGDAGVRDTTVGPSRDTASRGAIAAAVGRGPAIVLRASASAREVRFAAQPQISVRLCGGVMDSVRILERRNLPDPVQPGVTYRDVFIAVEILGHLNAQCLAGRITGADPRPGDCASLQLRDSAATGLRRPPP